MKISAVVLTKNEEETIRDCIESLFWCDEIIIIDDYSEDKTLEIIQNAKVKIYNFILTCREYPTFLVLHFKF